MTMMQFRVLYRQFLFRMVDLELLSPQGDMTKLLGQFAAVLIVISVLLAVPALFFPDMKLPPLSELLFVWTAQHRLIATTMLVVGLFAVLSWDSTFPDKRDVLVLAPLPVRTRTLFLAKVAAVGTALSVTVLALHSATGVLWPAAFAKGTAAQPAPAFRYHSAMPPADTSGIEKLVERDLTAAMAQWPGAGATVGVFKKGVRRVFSYGAVAPDSLFEIGAMAQTFTGLALERMVEDGSARMHEPVRQLLPPEGLPGRAGREITLVDLATHQSGLPAREGNAGVDDLYALLRQHGLARTPGTGFRYSDIGYELLGVALAHRAGTSNAGLIEEKVTAPLGLKDTVADAAGIRSSASDMIAYLEAHLVRSRIPAAWRYNAETGAYWSDAGNSGYAFFHPKGSYAAVVLLHRVETSLPFAGFLGEHIRQRFAGEPAVSFVPVSIPRSGGIRSFFRVFFAYWVTMLASGAFVFCCVLGVQGLASQFLPRRWFLRVSSFLQMAAFCFFVCVYFLQPPVVTASSLMAAQSNALLPWVPSYWFLGLFQELNGSPALTPLAQRAWVGLAIAICGTGAAYALSYLRTMRRIVEEPDIVAGAKGGMPLPAFGNLRQTAIVQFSIRTLFRSRQHRVVLAFYLGIAFALTILFLRTPLAQKQLAAWSEVTPPLLASSILLMGFWIVGVRMVFSLPLDLRANWMFRVMPLRGGSECMAARRRALYALSVVPAWTAAAVALFFLWEWRAAASHLVVLGLLAVILGELCLRGGNKLPFTCSYLPGGSNVHMAFWFGIGLLHVLVNIAAGWERQALGNLPLYFTMVGVLCAVAVSFRWRNAGADDSLAFDDTEKPAVLQLGLHRDGVMPIGVRASGPSHTGWRL